MLQTELAGMILSGSSLQQGLNAQGAQISGHVFLNGAHSYAEVCLSGAVISRQLACNGASLYNAGGHALNAQGARIGGGVFLREVQTKGEVGLPGAAIASQLDCKGASLRNAGGYALNAQGAQIGADVFLRKIEIEGEARLCGAAITGQLESSRAILRNRDGDTLNAEGARIGGHVFLREVLSEGEVRLSGLAITGQLGCEGATLLNTGKRALNAQRLAVAEGFYWRGLKEVKGNIELASAHVGDLVDDTESWRKCDKLSLVGFTYDILHGTTHVPSRLDWLQKGALSRGDFHPQPYEQLAKNLRESGHRAEAREILMVKEREQRKAVRGRRRQERRWRRDLARNSQLPPERRDAFIAKQQDKIPKGSTLDRFLLLHPSADKADFVPPLTLAYAQQDFRNQQRWANTVLRMRNMGSNAIDQVFRLSVGYGYKPWRSLHVLAVLILAGWLCAHQAWHNGDVAPNSDVILLSDEWQRLATDDKVANPAKQWSERYLVAPSETELGVYALGRDYETFQPAYYAIDIVIPIISLGQETAWAPSTNRGDWGRIMWWLRYWLKAAGWIVTAIGAAAVTGIIRRD